MIEVLIQKKIKVSKAWICRIIEKVLRAEKRKGSIGVLITGDHEIRKLNRSFLKHDTTTDVIAFPLGSDRNGSVESLRGDLVVSADTARRVAKEMGIPYKEELARYLVHGTLHLLGYDDHKKKDFKRMHERQEEILRACLNR